MANGTEQVTPVDSVKDVVRSSVKVSEFDKHLKKARGHIGRNVEITIKIKTIVQNPLKFIVKQISKIKSTDEWGRKIWNNFIYFFFFSLISPICGWKNMINLEFHGELYYSSTFSLKLRQYEWARKKWQRINDLFNADTMPKKISEIIGVSLWPPSIPDHNSLDLGAF